MSKIYGYCFLVSTRGQHEEKLAEQEKIIKKLYPEAEIIKEVMGYEKYKRPKFNDLVDKCEKGDMIVCSGLEKYCKSTKEIISVSDKLLGKGVKVHIINIGILDDSATGKFIYKTLQTSVYKGYKQDKIEMRGDRAEMSDFPLYLNTVAGGLDRRDQTIGGFSFVVKIYAVPVVEIIG